MGCQELVVTAELAGSAVLLGSCCDGLSGKGGKGGIHVSKVTWKAKEKRMLGSICKGKVGRLLENVNFSEELEGEGIGSAGGHDGEGERL